MNTGKSFLTLPTRDLKPRNVGITMSLDKGLTLSECENILSENSEYIDYVKLGWGTSVIYSKLVEKIELYKKYGIQVCLGGTLFEIAEAQNKLEDYISWASELNIDLIEISDGTCDIDRTRKLQLIEKFSKYFVVVSEYGSKDGEKQYAPSQWVKGIQQELQAGSWKVVAEGRESGTAGLYRDTSEVRSGLVSDILEAIDHSNIIWETPQKQQQVWFINLIGSNVNLGNIIPEELMTLETLRLGLRSDTLLKFHGNA